MNFQNQNLLDKISSIGTDPEIFLFGKKGLIPAFAFLPEKLQAEENQAENPYKLFWDGFQAEWNYSQGRESIGEILWDIKCSMRDLRSAAKEFDPTAELSLINVVKIEDELLNNALDNFVALGCKPSHNAYGNKGLKVEDPRTLKYRFAGGHMIFDVGRRRPDYKTIVKTLDKILGVWSIGAAKNIDNPLRRKYYGLAGEFRLPKFKKDFGIEYRTLSNFWLSSPTVAEITWTIAREAVKLGMSKYAKYWIATDEEVQEAINTCNTNIASVILNRNEEMFRWLMKDYFDSALNITKYGIDEGLEEHKTIAENWGLDGDC